MSDTPRTDALEKIDRDEWDEDPHTPEESFDYYLVYDIAREFERELAALRSDNLTAHKMACAAGIERDILRAELAAKNAEADTARLDWLFQDAELNLFFADRAEIDAAMKEAVK